jgi:collagen type III alpha
VLCGIMAVIAAYKILSPKDPFQTAARVLVPWADIARPSRVQIAEVQPGSTEVYYGQTVPISATLRGVREGDAVNVLYTTADGQAINRPVPMKLAAGDRYEGTLPPADAASPAAVAALSPAMPSRLNID